jgi:hypothetical protein
MNSCEIKTGLANAEFATATIRPAKPKPSFFKPGFVAQLMAMSMSGMLPRPKRVKPPKSQNGKVYATSKWHRRMVASGLK